MANRKHLSQNLNPEFKYYIYVYLNPLKPGKFAFGKLSFDYQPFYIGLGSGKRIDRHIAEAKDLNQFQTEKLKIIQRILRKGKEPIRYKLYENLTLATANRLEKYLIDFIGRKKGKRGYLTNISTGGVESLHQWRQARDYLICGEDHLLAPTLNCLDCSGRARLRKEKGNFRYNEKQYKIISYFYKCPKCKLEFTTTRTDSSAFFQAWNLRDQPNYKSDNWLKLYKKD